MVPATALGWYDAFFAVVVATGETKSLPNGLSGRRISLSVDQGKPGDNWQTGVPYVFSFTESEGIPMPM
ncbi:MAG: hypothetical protein KA712_07925 [Myxococcales bacterium]|nr:hypothetical protein [Myxococcales bacterium]